MRAILRDAVGDLTTELGDVAPVDFQKTVAVLLETEFCVNDQDPVKPCEVNVQIVPDSQFVEFIYSLGNLFGDVGNGESQ